MNDASMPLLLTMVSALAVWAFLTTLVVGLVLIFKPLEAVRGHVQRILAGVRAIETETSPLLDLTKRLPDAAATLRESLDPLAARLGEFEQAVDYNARTLRRLRRP